MLKQYNICGKEFRLYNKMLQPQTIEPIECSCNEVKKYLSLSGALLARWTVSYSDIPTNIWYLAQTEYHPLEDYDPRTRTRLRRGMERFKLSDLHEPSADLADVIWKIDSKFGAYIQKDKNCLKKHLESLTSNYKFLFVIDEKDEYVGYLLLYIEENYLEIRTIHILREAQKRQAAYFVYYKLSEIFLKDRDYKIVMGLRNFLHPTKVQELLEQKFFYERLYVKMDICLSLKAKLIYVFFRPFLPLIKRIPLHAVNKLKAFLLYIYFVRTDKRE